MTRNPETTEAARLRAAIEAELAVTGKVSCAGYTVDDDGCYVFNLARRIRAVLAVSPAVTEGEWARCSMDAAECQASWEAQRTRALEAEARLAAPPAVTEGERARAWFDSQPEIEGSLHNVIRDAQAAQAERMTGRASAPSPAVTAAEDETPGCDHRYSTREVLRPRATCVRCGHVSIRPAPAVAAVPADPNKEN